MVHLKANNGVYVSRKVVNTKQFIDWALSVGFKEVNSDPHVTVAYSRECFINPEPEMGQFRVEPRNFIGIDKLGDATVLKFKSNTLQNDFKQKIKAGATWDYPDYHCHVTISYGIQDTIDMMPDFPLLFSKELNEELNENYTDEIDTISN